MKQIEIINIINNFNEFIEDETLESENSDLYLLMLLDSLGLAISKVQYVFDEKDYPDLPEIEYNEVRNMITNKLKDYGYYNSPQDLINNLADTQILVGDAVDDIADIYLELKKIQWMWDNTNHNNALWWYQNNYQVHWGEHLRDLQRYIYYKVYR